jgi:hypothetical protein
MQRLEPAGRDPWNRESPLARNLRGGKRRGPEQAGDRDDDRTGPKGGTMTTSRQTEALNHPAIRDLVNAANALPLGDRVTLLKALIPEVAREMSPREFEATMVDLRLKGERYYDALTHPGQGRDSRHVMGERDIERR